jgi:5-methylcytosine-specific restriction endonuclease McrA
VLKRALDSLVLELEKQKFAKSARSRPQRGAANGRRVPAEVKRTVWQRDHGQCTFVSDRGKRCEATTRLEFDHIEPVARGGQASVGGIRLRCRAHNQYAAERTFGTEFMRWKREGPRSSMGRTAPTASAPA